MKKATKRSKFEWLVQRRLDDSKFSRYEIEYKFHPDRRWRFDFAWPKQMVAIECEGGSWVMGRHNRGSGFAADCEKYNAAVRLGWRVLRYTPQQIDAIVPDLMEIM